MTARSKGLREIEWGLPGTDHTKLCIYDNGHIDPSRFLERLRAFNSSSVERCFRDQITADQVTHSRFRPMTPNEAREWGADSGVMEAEDGHKGYPVTLVIL